MDINKNLLSLAAIIAALSIGYYFVVFLPTSKQAEILSLNNSKCAQTAEEVFRGYNVSAGSSSTHYSSHYNVKLSKCFVEITDNSGVSTDVEIYDAVENKELAWAYLSVDKTKGDLYASVDIHGANTDISKTQFETLEKQYMSE